MKNIIREINKILKTINKEYHLRKEEKTKTTKGNEEHHKRNKQKSKKK